MKKPEKRQFEAAPWGTAFIYYSLHPKIKTTKMFFVTVFGAR